MKIKFIAFVALTVLLLQGCKKGEERVTPSGYQYIVHTNAGGPKPQPGEYVYFHAQMRNADSVVYSSRSMAQAPFLQMPTDVEKEMNSNRPASPIEEVLRDMAVGDSVTVIIRIDTLPVKPPGFENVKEMFYDVVAIEIKDAETFQKDVAIERENERIKREDAQKREPQVAVTLLGILDQYKAGKLTDKIKTTSSGLKYMVIEKGNGPKMQKGNMVGVHYYGVLLDGSMFDNSFNRGSAYVFPLGQGSVIKGWDEGIALLNEGDKAVLFIPSALGYGDEGSGAIPPGAELVFYVEPSKPN
ncbi:MAG: FKBP-type peptidyl-prolyl cis-trans isomerase [Saprospiraceae bacterium]|nr:FKBP-type peptidyl-prolyl cis-trans isomerase [Saprospiraceae bacterium]